MKAWDSRLGIWRNREGREGEVNQMNRGRKGRALHTWNLVYMLSAWGLHAMALQQVHHTGKQKPRRVGSVGVRYCQSCLEKWKQLTMCHN